MTYSRFVVGYAALWLASVPALSAATWLTDQKAALEQAKAQNKLVLMDFTGSDWCPWCIKLKSEVFDTPEFASFADANLVLLEVDFPRRKVLPAQQRRDNAALSVKYNVEGYPTVIITDSTGRALAETGYKRGGAPGLIRELKSIPGYAWKDAGTSSDSPTAPPAARSAKAEEPLWGGLQTPTKRWDDIKLTGIGGTAARRFAIINNQTFSTGESARVKLKDSQVNVVCKEIRARSVLVQVNGSTDTKELFLDN